MPQLTIYVNPVLYQRLRGRGLPVSNVCQRALEAELDREEKLDELVNQTRRQDGKRKARRA